MKKNIPIIIFVFFVLIFSAGYVLYVYANGGPSYVEKETVLGEIGGGLGTIGFFLLALVYARTAFKLLVVKGKFWDRLEMIDENYSHARTLAQKILYFLNISHPYLGTLSIAMIFLHCFMTGNAMDNLLLKLVLVVMAWQGILGLFIKVKYMPTGMKRGSYLIHSQLFTGTLLLILAGFGHMLLGD